MPVTVPAPFPAFETFNKYVGDWATLKTAETAFELSIISEQLPVPLQAPDQPANTYPLAGTADRDTAVLAPYVSEQSAPHKIPSPDTVPEPVLEIASA